ncbi:MAG: M6 family metalloprotease domain-containing protein [Paludibacter sp.]|nr:M6 family metalloprotease domain-containing protein [Paludibacter sp.]
MRTTAIRLFISTIFLFFAVCLNAVPATPYPVKITQPDGTVLTVRLHGDEYFNYKTTLDGYALTPNTQGVLTYAKSDAYGNLISTSVKANDINQRTAVEKNLILNLTPNLNLTKFGQKERALRLQKSISTTSIIKGYPLTGSPKSIVILVNFKDVNFVTSNPKTAFTNLLNQSGYSTNGGTGSAKDYFHDSSMGVFNPQFDVVGPYTLPNNMAYYGANDASGNDTNPQQMVIDACTLAAAAGVDFSQYDTDKNGVVDNVFIYYAGYNEAEGGPANSIWPHRWTLNDLSTKFNGVSVYDYACTSELRGNTGSNMCGVGTFCHEFGHVLGLTDYYVTSGTDHHTLSTWNIMDYGPYLNLGRTPPSYSSWDRFYLNWLTPTELKTAGNYQLDTLSTSNTSYLISQNGNHNLIGSNPSPVEFFMLENRQQKGWDTYLPGHGMIVYHIYYNPTTWANNTVNNDPNAMGVDIVEADGIALTETTSLDPTLSGDPYPGTSHVTSFVPTLRDGTNIHKPLLNIQEINGKISFHFGTNIILAQNLQPFSTVQGTPSSVQTVTVSGSKLTNVVNISFKNGLHFEMKKQSDSIWVKSLILTPIDSVLTNTNIQIRYNPTVPSYTSVHSDTFILTSGTTDYADAQISGTSTRAVYVVPPIANEASDVSFTGFVANWSPVFDATGYYLTVYSLTDGESSITQGFDNGLVAPNGWTITPKSTSSSTIYSGITPPSILFSNTGELVETEKYLLPVTKLSFYLRSMGGSNGGFLIEAQNDQNNWEKVDSIPVTSTLNDQSKSYTFLETKGYDRFRFTYTKGLGSVAFDDVAVTFTKQLTYNLRESWVTSTTDTLTNLIPNTDYNYMVRASDKSVYYENITNSSNVIYVKTLTYPSSKKLVASVDTNGNITVSLPTKNTSLRIYNILGQTIQSITPQGTTVKISDLPRHQVYIIRANNLVTKIAI